MLPERIIYKNNKIKGNYCREYGKIESLLPKFVSKFGYEEIDDRDLKDLES